MICLVDGISGFIFVILAASLWVAAASPDDLDGPVNSSASSADDGFDNDEGQERGEDALFADGVSSGEAGALGLVLFVLGAFMLAIATITASAARGTGTRTRCERLSSMALTSSAWLTLPRATALLVLCFYALVRAPNASALLCRHSDAVLRGCTSSPRLVGSLFALTLAAVQLCELCAVRAFNAAVRASAERYAQMTEMESITDRIAREERRANISSKHNALREKYRARGWIPSDGADAGGAAHAGGTTAAAATRA